jgi:hypothetical protein
MKIFELTDGRKFLYQWDYNRTLNVNDNTITEVHFCYSNTGPVYAVGVNTNTTPHTAAIPNILLQQYGTFKVYAYVSTSEMDNGEEYTKAVEFFDVIVKSKPTDYSVDEDSTTSTWVNFNNELNNINGKLNEQKILVDTRFEEFDITFNNDIG